MSNELVVWSKYNIKGRLAYLNKIYKTLSIVGYLLIKRVFDIVCGLFGVICLVPLVIIVKISNLLSGDKAPVFFTQNRIGLDGKEFKFYKFRSMVPNADELLKELMEKDEKLAEEYRINKKLENDPRITKIGKILRRTSLDETPQFINVLKGDMSLIGNRPYLPREKVDMGDYFEDIVKTKPGLTGYWQVEGRSRTTFQKRLELEQYYSNSASLYMDLKIFFKTFLVVFCKRGAK